MSTILGWLDNLHAYTGKDLPRTTQAIEKLCARIDNLLRYMKTSRTDNNSNSSNNKRSLPFEDSEDRLVKKEKYAPISNEPRTHKEKENHVQQTQLNRERYIDIEPIPQVIQTLEDAKHAAPNNSFASLLLKPTLSLVDKQPKRAHPRHKHKAHEYIEERDKSYDMEERRLREAQQEKEIIMQQKVREQLEQWDREERQREWEQKTREMERLLREEERERQLEEEAIQQHIRERKEEQERLLRERVEEKERLAHEAQAAEQMKADEQFEKEIRHKIAHQQYLEEKAKRQKEKEIQKKRAEVEERVREALKQREKEEWEASAPQREADQVARELIREERVELEQERELIGSELQEETVEESDVKEEAIQAKAEAKEEKEKARKRANKAKRQAESIKREEKELVILGDTKVVDEKTHWTVHTESDEPWQVVKKSHTTHLQAKEVLTAPLLEDADNITTELKHNPFANLEDAPAPVGGASI